MAAWASNSLGVRLGWLVHPPTCWEGPLPVAGGLKGRTPLPCRLNAWRRPHRGLACRRTRPASVGGSAALGPPSPPSRSSDPPRAAGLLQIQPGLEAGREVQEAATSLLDLHLTTEGTVATVEGAVALAESLSGLASLTEARPGMLILGLETVDGAVTAIEDFPLAKVAGGYEGHARCGFCCLGPCFCSHCQTAPTPCANPPPCQLCCSRFVAGARNKLWWQMPRWGSTSQDITPETQVHRLAADLALPSPACLRRAPGTLRRRLLPHDNCVLRLQPAF